MNLKLLSAKVAAICPGGDELKARGKQAISVHKAMQPLGDILTKYNWSVTSIIFIVYDSLPTEKIITANRQ